MNKLTAAKNYLQQEIDILQHCKGYHAQGKLREAYESLADAHARIGDAKRSDEALAKAVGVAEQANSGSIDKGYLAEELVRIAKTHFDSASKDIKSRNLRVRTLLVRAIALMKPLAPDHSEECASALLALASVDLNLGDREAVAKDINEAIILTIARFEKWPGDCRGLEVHSAVAEALFNLHYHIGNDPRHFIGHRYFDQCRTNLVKRYGAKDPSVKEIEQGYERAKTEWELMRQQSPTVEK